MKRTKDKNEGITLIALVITIIILLILAGITISSLMGNGLFEKANNASEKSKQAEAEELVKLAVFESIGDNGKINLDILKNRLKQLGATGIQETLPMTVKLNGTDIKIDENGNVIVIGSTQGDEENTGGTNQGGDNPAIPEEPKLPTKIKEAKEIQTEFKETTTLKDDKDNEVTIPAGFKVAADSGDSVQQGIVIEDVSASGDENVKGSQFVWIPVGKVKKDDGNISNITLGRYTFDTTTGEPTLQQSADNYMEEVIIDSYCSELSTYREGIPSAGVDGLNATAKNLKSFVEKTQHYGGFYLARYEASYASGYDISSSTPYTNAKCASKISVANSTDSMSYDTGTLWHFVNELNASKVAINTYANSFSVKSDLVNSYAWDTAIVYIQKMGNDNYANQKDGNGTLKNTGETGDEKCKIFDMASNLRELTTEYSKSKSSDTIEAYPVLTRGGLYKDIYWNWVCKRGSFGVLNLAFGYNGFRPLLYII